MYCSNCGKIVNSSLSYCNHCGFRLSVKDDDGQSDRLSSSSFNFLVAALIGLPIAGIGVLIALLSVMKKGLGFGDEMIGIVVLMSFALFMIAELGILWQLWLHTRKPKRDKNLSSPAVLAGERDVVIKGLPESRIDPIGVTPGSVTEHTTRTLDAVPRD